VRFKYRIGQILLIGLAFGVGALQAEAASPVYYHVNSSAPDNAGVPDSNPDMPALANCWQTLGKAFEDLCVNEGNNLNGKGEHIIQIEDSATYTEGVWLTNLAMTNSVDHLTIQAAAGRRPTWSNSTSTVLFCNYDGINSYGAVKVSVDYTVIQGIDFTGTQEHGIYLAASYCTVRHCIFRDLTVNSSNYNHKSAALYFLPTGSQVYNNTFYNVVVGVFRPEASGNTGMKLRNNIFCVSGIGFLNWEAFSNLDSDYNCFQLGFGGRLAYAWNVGQSYTTLADWQAAAVLPAPDAHSWSGDPQFVTAGADFHLQSASGHWTAGGWINDASTSPCLDAGAPYQAGVEYTDYGNEPPVNGGRVNLGAYANTDQASRSGIPTATPTPTLVVTKTSTITRTITRTTTRTPTPTQSTTLTPTGTPTRTCTPVYTYTLTPTVARTGLPGVGVNEVIAYPQPATGDNLCFYCPSNGAARILIEIFNLTGEKVKIMPETLVESGIRITSWDIRDVAPGVYIYRSKSDFAGGVTTVSSWKKLVILKKGK